MSQYVAQHQGGGAKKIVGVWGWNLHPGRGWSPTGGESSQKL